MPPLSHSIVRQIESIGYAVSVHRLSATVVRDDGVGPLDIFPGPDYVELHAVRLADPDEQHIARCMDGDGEEETYRAACELARMVGIDLEG